MADAGIGFHQSAATTQVPELAKQAPHAWDPLAVDQVAKLLAPLGAPWWIAGGFAIELLVGRTIREHGDLDVVMLRRDQGLIRGVLGGWDCHIAHGGELWEWGEGEYLDAPYSDLWCREEKVGPWRLQLMLLDTEGEEWVFKRNHAIRGPLKELGLRSGDGVPYLRPEIQLLYKAKAQTLEKDQRDFEAALPLMDERSRRWLQEKLRVQFPAGHAWLGALG